MEKTTSTKVVGKSVVESRVRKRIEALKKSDLEGRKSMEKPEQMIPLEDLYQVPVPVVQYHEEIPGDLRKTLRIIEEKNVLIDQLRSSCYDLALKYADAENRIDQMRFGGGKSGVKSQSMQNLNFNLNAISLGHHNCTDAGEMSFLNYTTSSSINNNKRYSTSGIPWAIEGQKSQKIEKSQIEKCKKTNLPELTNTAAEASSDPAGISNQIIKKDQSTETELKMPTTTPSISQLSGDIEQITPGQNPIDSNCSSWLEKVQNWKTLDSTKSQDSCEFDSGFKGSATTAIVHLPVTSSKKTEIPEENNLEEKPGTSKDKVRRKGYKLTPVTINNSSETHAQLDLLLDEATIIAKRVKKKSQKLGEMLKELELESSNTNNMSISHNKK